MDEQEIQTRRRDNEESAAASRARILGLPYLDTRGFENNLPLTQGVLTKQEMHDNFVIPLQKVGEGEHYQFMVTSQTPRSVIERMRKEFNDRGEHADFFLITESAYKVFMRRYDPPQEAHYDDITIAGEGDSETLPPFPKC